MPYQLSDNAKAVLMAAITTLGALGTLWIQNHNQHVERMEVETNQHTERMEVEAKKVKALQSIDKQLSERKPLVFGKEQN